MSLLRDYQDALVAEIARRPFFARKVQVFSRKLKSVESEIEQAVANTGVAIFVFPPKPRKFESNIPSPTFREMEVVVRLIENPSSNQTGADAWDYWEELIKLHFWRPLNLPTCGALIGQSEPFQDQTMPKEDIRIFDCKFTVKVGL